MEELINDLLTLARESESPAELLSATLANVVEDCWRNIDSAGAELKLDTTRTIRADSGRLHRLLENLIRNAVDHAGEGATVRVGDLEDGFYIEDDGPGVPEQLRERIFEASYTTTPTGTGYGLSIVEQIVDAHGWEVTVIESAAGGARFEVTGVKSAS